MGAVSRQPNKTWRGGKKKFKKGKKINNIQVLRLCAGLGSSAPDARPGEEGAGRGRPAGARADLISAQGCPALPPRAPPQMRPVRSRGPGRRGSPAPRGVPRVPGTAGRKEGVQNPCASPHSPAGRGCFRSAGRVLAVRRRSEAVRCCPCRQRSLCIARSRHFWVLCTQFFLHPGIFWCFARCSIPPRSSPSPLSLLCSSHPSSSSSRALPFPLRHPSLAFPPHHPCTGTWHQWQMHCEAGFALCSRSGVQALGFDPWVEGGLGSPLPNHPGATGTAVVLQPLARHCPAPSPACRSRWVPTRASPRSHVPEDSGDHFWSSCFSRWAAAARHRQEVGSLGAAGVGGRGTRGSSPA